MILVTGGARSGKSRFAETKATTFGDHIVYIATATAFDQEMKDRIKKHQASRPDSWVTIEGYQALDHKIRDFSGSIDAILLDCVTVMATNLLFKFSCCEQWEQVDFDYIETKIAEEVLHTADAALKRGVEIIFVTNEIGMGVVPETVLGRKFRDIAGRINQMLAERADQVYFLVSGIPLKIK